jgi:hypothetical protein
MLNGHVGVYFERIGANDARLAEPLPHAPNSIESRWSLVRNRIFGIIGIVLGGAIFLRLNTMNDPPGPRVDVAGELVVVLFGAVMFLAGLNALFRTRPPRGD